jgi:orotate phosphoribosyltransferase
MVEDVVTTAGSSIKGVQALREGGAHVDTVCVVVDRGEGGIEALREMGVTLIPLLTLEELRARA